MTSQLYSYDCLKSKVQDRDAPEQWAHVPAFPPFPEVFSATSEGREPDEEFDHDDTSGTGGSMRFDAPDDLYWSSWGSDETKPRGGLHRACMLWFSPDINQKVAGVDHYHDSGPKRGRPSRSCLSKADIRISHKPRTPV